MYNVISTSKYENETISIVLDFSDLLKPGESVSTCAFFITVLTGLDPSPDNILYQTYIPRGTKVDQKFRLGVPGVIYEIIFQVLGTSGSLVEKATSLAILPQDGLATPRFTFIYVTTYLYPYNIQDSMTASMLPYRGLDLGYLPEGITVSMGPSSGFVYGSSTTYNIPLEILTVNPTLPITGSIWGGQVTYPNYAPEGVNGFLAPVTGSTFDNSLSYNMPTTYEGLNISMSPTSGTIH